ncbi:MAG: rhomboid family intramembrane serine protease [Rhodospirillaceae bacterium]|jgi:membrane associated rhomboid family serine protease|nr:rhomboid family intramembrane serine protease [Rhodospirillaceae bacterium]MBT3925391.1 rhomboid family intramembrane serine protease [Rhodospirillaceae bacterium]MBT4427886.1 rhomboid family intramembrane serine protease [Rhodospirillaceae bacterium]MBT5038553.1 rhomboid family intramembrane serine protease [Rhodospirillaceae bacterium]MBT5677722.1 rhomboid family intramembrane serine protease [Rhodospirillaceae bacterium]
MLPIKDNNPTHITPYVTIALIAVNVVVFLITLALPDGGDAQVKFALGAIPAVIFQVKEIAAQDAILPSSVDFLSVITSQFLHAGWWHLIGNMLYLWVFGNNIEDAMGHVRFLIFYLLCGACAALINAGVEPDSIVPTIGASGAVSGVLGAYLLLYPRAKVLVFAFYMLLPLPAFLVLGLWIVMQVVNLGGGGESNIAWWAHVGGFAVGMVLVLLFKYRHVKLFGRGDLNQTAHPGLAAVAAVESEPDPEPDRPGPWGPEIKGPWLQSQPRPKEPRKRRSTIPQAGNRDKD